MSGWRLRFIAWKAKRRRQKCYRTEAALRKAVANGQDMGDLEVGPCPALTVLVRIEQLIDQ